MVVVEDVVVPETHDESVRVLDEAFLLYPWLSITLIPCVADLVCGLYSTPTITGPLPQSWPNSSTHAKVTAILAWIIDITFEGRHLPPAQMR